MPAAAATLYLAMVTQHHHRWPVRPPAEGAPMLVITYADLCHAFGGAPQSLPMVARPSWLDACFGSYLPLAWAQREHWALRARWRQRVQAAYQRHAHLEVYVVGIPDDRILEAWREQEEVIV